MRWPIALASGRWTVSTLSLREPAIDVLTPILCLFSRNSASLNGRSHQMGLQRLAALRFLAAMASRLEGPPVVPYLPIMLRPLYRITEAASGNSEEVRPLLHRATRLTTSPGAASDGKGLLTCAFPALDIHGNAD